ncbi:IS701 family transposase [Streptomyces incanus]
MRGWESVTQFTDQLFGHLRRADQRRWAHAYIRGLLRTPGKKSIRRLAAAASDSPTASQALHQFINESPWEWTPACNRLREWAEDRVRPRAWTIVPVVLPKRGDKSCGVHRRFVPRTGRTVNCQVGTAVFMSTDVGEFPMGWNLLLPAQWAHGSRREQARIPQEAASSPEGVVLHLLDQLVQGSPHEDVPVIVDLEGYMEARRLINGLNQRRRDFVVTVPESLPMIPFSPLARAHRKSVMTAAEILSEHRTRSRFPDGRTGGAQTRHSLARIPGAAAADPQPQPLRLFARLGTPAAGPGSLWITNMVQAPVEELLRHTDRHTTTRETVDLLERGFGLRDFEGRSFPGWHRHMTLVSAAFTYSRLAVDLQEQSARPPTAA